METEEKLPVRRRQEGVGRRTWYAVVAADGLTALELQVLWPDETRQRLVGACGEWLSTPKQSDLTFHVGFPFYEGKELREIGRDCYVLHGIPANCAWTSALAGDPIWVRGDHQGENQPEEFWLALEEAFRKHDARVRAARSYLPRGSCDRCGGSGRVNGLDLVAQGFQGVGLGVLALRACARLPSAPRPKVWRKVRDLSPAESLMLDRDFALPTGGGLVVAVLSAEEARELGLAFEGAVWNEKRGG